jgi:diguanylate cyclase (GGDEF)-like protein
VETALYGAVPQLDASVTYDEASGAVSVFAVNRSLTEPLLLSADVRVTSRATLGVAFNRMADELKARARTDDLTALPNFRAFRERIDAELERADRYPERIGILVMDLDRFKKYNDTYGHAAGNDALQRVAHAIRQAVRSVDFPARYGGEEFAVILPQVDELALGAIAERIRAGVEAAPAPPDGAKVTVSIGAALYPDDARDREALFQLADARLYEAKAAGRNRVITPRAAQSAARRSG